MPKAQKNISTKMNATAMVGYEAKLWPMADALRGSMDAAEYKPVVLGLIFLKYISDALEEQHARPEAECDQGADLEDPDEYRAVNIFWVPPEARWAHLKAHAKQCTIGQLVDAAMGAIERDNPALRGVLPKDYAHPALDKQRLGQLIDLVSNIKLGDAESRSKDVLGRVYEYFLAQFASAEGKKGGECQELNYTMWHLATMNLAIRGIEGQIAQGDTFHNDRFPDLKADFILADPPFNGMRQYATHATFLEEGLTWKTANSPGSPISFGALLTTCCATSTCAASTVTSFSR